MADIKISLTSEALAPDRLKPAAQQPGWSQRFASAFNAALYPRISGALAAELDQKAKALADCCRDFAWPGQDTLPGARLIVADPGLDGRVDASLPAPGLAARYEKWFSRGFDPTAGAKVTPGRYSFEMSLGDESEEATITVGEDWSNGDLLDAVADAVNGSGLKAQAQVVRQASAGQRVADLLATGSALVMSVNPAQPDQNLTLRDTSGHLVSALDLTAAPAGGRQAETALYHLLGERTFQPSLFQSSVLDPNAAATLAPGAFSFNWSLGPDSGTASMNVDAGDTWRDVLDNLGLALSQDQERITARTDLVPRPAYVNGQRVETEGVMLAVQAVSPKPGQRLLLSGADAASETALAALGLDSTAAPGSDAAMDVDADSLVRAPGSFDRDRGLVRMDLTDSFGEPLPLRVVEALGRLEKGLADAVNAYNDLRIFLKDNAANLEQGLDELWRDPVSENATDLQTMGLREAQDKQLLWLDADAFYAAMGSDSEAVRDLLTGEDGLFTRWTEASDQVRSAGAQALLAPPTARDNDILGQPRPMDELQLEQTSRLVNILDDAKGAASGHHAWDVPAAIVKLKA